MSHDYGKCHACGSPIEERLTEQSINEQGDWLVIQPVPTGVCTKCGEQVFRAAVVRRLEQIRLERKQGKPEAHIEVPVFAF